MGYKREVCYGKLQACHSGRRCLEHPDSCQNFECAVVFSEAIGNPDADASGFHLYS